MREGICADLALGIRNLCIEGDNLVVVNYLRKTWEIPWDIHQLVCDERVDLLQFGNVSFSYSMRSQSGC